MIFERFLQYFMELRLYEKLTIKPLDDGKLCDIMFPADEKSRYPLYLYGRQDNATAPII